MYEFVIIHTQNIHFCLSQNVKVEVFCFFTLCIIPKNINFRQNTAILQPMRAQQLWHKHKTREVMHDRSNREYHLLAIRACQESVYACLDSGCSSVWNLFFVIIGENSYIWLTSQISLASNPRMPGKRGTLAWIAGAVLSEIYFL